MSRTVIVVNSGDGTGLNFSRCLRMSGDYKIVGVDNSLADYHGSEADLRYFVDWRNEDSLISFLNEVGTRHSADLLYIADTNREIVPVSVNRAEISSPMFLPPVVDHLLMEDKWKTWQRLFEMNLPVPDTELAEDSNVIKMMLDRHGEVWLRRVSGSAGAGSVATDSIEFATAWLDRNDGWGNFTVAERLTGRTATFSGLWFEGELVASQLRERLGWKYPALSVSGVTGITGGQKTTWDESLHDLATRCVLATCSVPHGAIGVDFTYSPSGQPLPTEVQPARLYSSMQFLAEAGINLPSLYCDLAIGGRSAVRGSLINPVRVEHYWVKGVDRLPQMMSEDEYYANPVDGFGG